MSATSRRDSLLPSLTWERRVRQIGVFLKLRPRRTNITARPNLPTVCHQPWCTMWMLLAMDLTTGQRAVPSHRRNTTASVWSPAQPPSHLVAAVVAVAAAGENDTGYSHKMTLMSVPPWCLFYKGYKVQGCEDFNWRPCQYINMHSIKWSFF